MPKIIKVNATEDYLKIYFFKLYQRKKEFHHLEIDEEKLNQIIVSKSLSQMTSAELFNCISVELDNTDYEDDSDFIYGDQLVPNYFYYLDAESNFNKSSIVAYPFLYTDIEQLNGIDLYTGKIDSKGYFGFDLLNKDGFLLMKLTSKFSSDKKISIEVLGDYNLFIFKTDSSIKGLFSYVNNEFSKIDKIDDKEIMIELIRLSYNQCLKFASDQLRNDKDVFFSAIKNDNFDFAFASDSIRNDKNLVLLAVKKNGDLLKYVSSRLRNDKEIVLTAISHDGDSLKFASDAMKNDKEVVLQAVSKNGFSIKYASDAIKNDYEVALTAVSKDAFSLIFVSEDLRNNNNVVYAALSRNGNVFKYASDRLKNNKEIALFAISKSKNACLYLGDNLREDFDIISLLNNNDTNLNIDLNQYEELPF